MLRSHFLGLKRTPHYHNHGLLSPIQCFFDVSTRVMGAHNAFLSPFKKSITIKISAKNHIKIKCSLNQQSKLSASKIKTRIEYEVYL